MDACPGEAWAGGADNAPATNTKVKAQNPRIQYAGNLGKRDFISLFMVILRLFSFAFRVFSSGHPEGSAGIQIAYIISFRLIPPKFLPFFPPPGNKKPLSENYENHQGNDNNEQEFSHSSNLNLRVG
jgi:hypothetical protein